jgi:hypothetical protein
MTTQAWHLDDQLLSRYLADDVDMALAASVEAHLVRCAGCRAALAGQTNPVELAPVWAGVQAAIQRPPVPLPLRVLRRLGVSERDVVLLNAAELLRGPWTFATAVVLIFAVVASWPGNIAGQAAYLLVAPLVPVLGVVGAFAATDPVVEITNATPYSKTRLALLRSGAVIVTTVPLVVFVGAVMPGIGWLAVAWLGPALGLILATLVALTWWSPVNAGTAVSIVWAAVITAAYVRHDLMSAIERDAQIGYLVVAALIGAGLVARIRTAHTPGGYA